MSKKLASISEFVVDAITYFSSARQKSKTLARLMKGLSERSYGVINCSKGQLLLDKLRSPHAASAAEHFFIDEPETLEWIDGFEDGQTFFDIGAGVGIYSLYAALNPALKVFSFEPNGFSFGLFLEHIRINNLSKQISPFCLALGQKTEIENLLFNQVSEGAGGSTFYKEFQERHKKNPVFSQSVISFSVDEFVELFKISAPTHIKIDVDGLEPAIIAGAKKTLCGVQSIMVEVELGNLDRKEESLDLPLKKLGFEESDLFKGIGSGRNRFYRKKSA